MKNSNSLQNIMYELNVNIENYLSDNDIKPRSGAGQGLWLCFILPVCVILGTWNYPDCSHFYRSVTCISVGLLLSSLTIIFFINQTARFRTSCCVINSITTTLMLGCFSDHSLIFTVLLGAFSSFGFNKLISTILQISPESFTFGEASVIVEAAIIFFSSIFGSLFSTESVTCVNISTKILQVGITGLAVLSLGVYFFPQLRKPTEFYTALAIILIAIVVLLHIILGFSAVLWIINLIIEDTLTLQIVGAWIVLTAAAVAAAASQMSAGQKASTVVRKYFHVLALCVFISGLLLTPCLLYLASGIIFALFLGLEMVRVLKLPPAAATLDSVFQVFADEKDYSLALTPIYLLVGCSAPLWLHPGPATTAPLLPLMAGLLSVGVGDTAASICGSWFGRHHWPDSQKTKEGTAACFISQLFFVIALIHFGYVPRNNLLQPIVAIAVVSWVEATTDQIDNLALPLLMYAILL